MTFCGVDLTFQDGVLGDIGGTQYLICVEGVVFGLPHGNLHCVKKWEDG